MKIHRPDNFFRQMVTVVENDVFLTFFSRAHLWIDNEICDVDTSEDQSGKSDYKTKPGWGPLETVASLCNRAEFRKGEESKPVLKREVNGDASEAAILKLTELTKG